MDSDTLPLVPARMLNEYVYCPRLAYIEWIEHDFRDNAFTADGRYQHRRVDRPSPSGGLASASTAPGGEGVGSSVDADEGDDGEDDADEPSRPLHARSIQLTAERAGIVARVDVVEAEGRRATPIEYKRGRPPDVPEGAYLPERVQLCAQVIVLEENGFEVPDEAAIYFVGARKRVPIAITEELRAATLQAVEALRELATAKDPAPPPVLLDSPRCFGCSLTGLCLPDEIGLLSDRRSEAPRQLFPHRDDALPLHVQQQGGRLGKSGECLQVIDRDRKPVAKVRLRDTSYVAIYGNVQVSTQAIRALREHEIPLTFSSYGGWFFGMLVGLPHGNVELRRRQHAAAADPRASLPIARSLVNQKIRNQRTVLRRNHPKNDALQVALASLKRFARRANEAASTAELLGIEGSAARVYFGAFPALLVKRGAGLDFTLDGRTKRPPRDPVNALLSFLYSLLAKQITVTLTAVGFEPLLGFYHQERHGRPSLALDLMEPFRPLIADSVVLSLINKGTVTPGDFWDGAGGVALKSGARRRVIGAFEQRLDELITHPVFNYRISYRRILEVHARLLARYLAGEIPDPPSFVTR